MVERDPGIWRRAVPSEWKLSVILRNGLPLSRRQPLGDPSHLRVLAPPVGISLKLTIQVARVESSQSWRTGAVAQAVHSVTSEAGVSRSRLGAAQGDQLPVLSQAIGRSALYSRASRGQRTQEDRGGKMVSTLQHMRAIARRRGWFPSAGFLPLMLGIAACKPPPDQSQFLPQANVAQGKVAMERAGCGACHTIPGVRWPKGKVGPKLEGLAERALIAGVLPNRPDVLAAYIRNAPRLVPGSGMPAMPVSKNEARDIAAYLYEQGGD